MYMFVGNNDTNITHINIPAVLVSKVGTVSHIPYSQGVAS